MHRYGLPCGQLAVGDCCIALSQLVQPPVSPVAVPADARRSSSSNDAPLDYSALGAAGSDPGRPGVIRTVAGSSRCGRRRSSSASAADSVACAEPGRLSD